MIEMSKDMEGGRVSFKLLSDFDGHIHANPLNRSDGLEQTICGIPSKELRQLVQLATMVWCESCRRGYHQRNEKDFSK